MPEPGTPSFDQLRVLLTVADHGTLTAAGLLLGRTPSAISYTLSQLEGQLGVALFDRQATRKLRLTEAGIAVLAEARVLARDMDMLRARVKGLRDGLEAEVSLAVDVMFPTDRLVAILRAFQSEFPTVGIRLHVEALGAVTQKVLDGSASLAVSGPLPVKTDGLAVRPAGEIAFIAVAAPGHPLAADAGAAADHLQLVLTDRSRLTEGQDFAVLAVKTWRLADLGAKHALLLGGIGWGHMPAHIVRDDLAAGRLVALRLPQGPGGSYRLQILHLAGNPPGPAARWLIGQFGTPS